MVSQTNYNGQSNDNRRPSRAYPPYMSEMSHHERRSQIARENRSIVMTERQTEATDAPVRKRIAVAVRHSPVITPLRPPFRFHNICINNRALLFRITFSPLLCWLVWALPPAEDPLQRRFGAEHAMLKLQKCWNRPMPLSSGKIYFHCYRITYVTAII